MTDAVTTVANVTAKAVSSDAVQNKILGMLDALQQGAVTVGNAVVKYSPDVANTMLDVIRIDGIQTIGLGVILLIYVIICAFTCAWALRKTKEYDFQPADFIGMVAALTGLVAIIFAGSSLLNIWNWIEVFQPKLWVAHEVIKTALPHCNC